MVDWGSVPDWLSGVGGIGALVAAVVAVLYSQKAYRLQQEQVAELARDRRQGQAAKVAVWLDSDEEEGASRYFVVANGSELPIYNIAIGIIGEPRSVARREILTPGLHRIEAPRTTRLGLAPSYWMPTIGFTTPDTGRWIRSYDGSLERVPDASTSGQAIAEHLRESARVVDLMFGDRAPGPDDGPRPDGPDR